MSERKNTSVTGGVGVSGLLGVLFVGLKLTGHISWPWLWVLSPFWIPLAIAAVALMVALIFWGLVMFAVFLRKS